ncbi:ABC transporter permease [Clostridium sp.]|uniref:ABC transporter permease n=1 Tax=Clostridium sp. TaxID=1506 RepID=UPI0034645CE0
MKSLNINPVLLKETKVRMRGWRTPVTIFIYNLVLMAVAYLVLKAAGGDSSAKSLFMIYAVISGIQFGLITLIAPTLTAGAISGEREKQTLDILLSTDMRYSSIILGKLSASLSQVILLIVSSIPILSLVFVFGGIGFLDIMKLFLFYLVITITLGSMGVFFSTIFKKTTVSNVMSYVTIIFFYVVIFFIAFFYIRIYVMPEYMMNNQQYNGTFWIHYLNPGIAFISLMYDQLGESFRRIMPGLEVSSGGLQLWHINMMINIGISATLIGLSSYKINPRNRKVIKKKLKKK